jgi:hypothetical protein
VLARIVARDQFGALRSIGLQLRRRPAPFAFGLEFGKQGGELRHG